MTNACYCLCGINHPSVPGLCGAVAETKVYFWVGEEPERERVAIPMCSRCAAATLAHSPGASTTSS
jgi:hypothetical protein